MLIFDKLNLLLFLMNIVITGATKGIGRAIADLFATREQGRLAIAARTEADLQRLSASFAEHYPQMEVLACCTDLSSEAGVDRFAQLILQKWEHIDVLVNNAGAFIKGGILEEPDDALAQMLALNLVAPYRLTRALLPLMLNQGYGHIFNIASIAGRKIFADSAAYTISKHALIGFSGVLREWLKTRQIKVTTVMPGHTWSQSWEGSTLPPQRILAAEEVALAVYNAWKTAPGTVIEEIILRPQLGDLS